MTLRNLLVPTDFSDEAHTSLQFALSLAKDTQAKVYVLNSYYIPITTIEADYVADQAIWLEQSRQRAQEEMQLLETRLLKEAGVPYECLMQPGPTMDDINLTIKDEQIGLVIIGTYKSGRLESFFGELFTQAISHAKAPVLLVPEGSTYVRPRKVVFATDLKPFDNLAPLENLRDILLLIGAHLELLHVYKNGDKPASKALAEMERLKGLFAAASPTTTYLEAESTKEGVLNYIEKNNADWLMAVAHNYGLLEGLFHSSHTKKLARHTPVPLLVSHE